MRENTKGKFREENYICFTSDLDWAPEAAIRMTLELFRKNRIHPTIFVTHKSMEVERSKNEIDLGIHPNFIQPSSQGESMEEIIDYCVNLVPETKVFRAHRWYSSNDVYDRLLAKGFVYESNLCTGMDLVDPFVQRSGMISFPVFFEDGAYILHSDKIDFGLVKQRFMQNGLKVINIHPMHYALNTPYFQYTRRLKDSLSRQEWNEMDDAMLESLRYQGQGIADFILELIDFAVSGNAKIITLEQAYQMYIWENE